MFVIVAGRQLGKTVTAVRWLLEQPMNRVLIVVDEDRKKHVSRVALRLVTGTLGTDGNAFQRFVSDRIIPAAKYSWFMRSTPARGCEIGIDDAEEVLRVIFQGRVEFAAFNATLIPVVGSSTINGDYIDAEQTSVDGIRPHRYPKSSEEAEILKQIATKAQPDPERLEEIRRHLRGED